jgi:DNA-binding NtrC family response regulator
MSQIMIVDDEVGIRELLSEILSDEGHQVLLAENAESARRLRERQRPDLVLLDIWMPDTDGITLLKEWAASGQLTMPVVMMSGHGTIETAVEATRVGALDYLRSRSRCSGCLPPSSARCATRTRRPRRRSRSRRSDAPRRSSSCESASRNLPRPEPI